MIKIEHTEVYGWEAAVRGMRNPMNSWDKSDSTFSMHDRFIGEADLDLMMRLAKAGSVHAKYRRMITVTCDITAPLYWWKEYDTYKVGTVANSCSTMHKIHSKEFEWEDFSTEHIISAFAKVAFQEIIDSLEIARNVYLETKSKCAWDEMIQLLPSSYNQRRTVQLNYEVLSAMYRDRKDHKLDEWRDFCKWIGELPYSEVITL